MTFLPVLVAPIIVIVHEDPEATRFRRMLRLRFSIVNSGRAEPVDGADEPSAKHPGAESSEPLGFIEDATLGLFSDVI